MTYGPPPGVGQPADVGRDPSFGGVNMPDESDESIAPRSGKVGDFLEGVGQYGLRAGWRVLMITYPADEAFTDAGMTIPDGVRLSDCRRDVHQQEWRDSPTAAGRRPPACACSTRRVVSTHQHRRHWSRTPDFARAKCSMRKQSLAIPSF